MASIVILCVCEHIQIYRRNLPDLGTTRILVLTLTIPHLKVQLGFFEPSRDQVYVPLRGPYATRGFLLERVKNVDNAFKSDRVNRPIRIASMVLDDFKDARPF